MAWRLRGRRGVRDRGNRVRSGPGPRVVREAPHGAYPGQRVHVPDPRAPGGAGLLVATRVDVGSAQEVPGITGFAHMFEHMAFKGTPRLGTKDYAKEKVAIDELEAAYMRTNEREPSSNQTRPRSTPPESVQGEGSRGAGIRGRQRVRRRVVAGGWRRPERRDQRRSHHLLLLAADQQVRAVRVSRVRAVPPSRVPGVLQGTRRRHGRAATAYREPSPSARSSNGCSRRPSSRTPTSSRRSAT